MIKLMRIRLGEVVLDVWSGVYPPRRSTKMLVKNMNTLSGRTVLDLGCGSGIIGIVAALRGAGRVVCLDISLRACRNAVRNFRLNELAERVDVVAGDGSSCLRDSAFDVVVLNPPMTPSPRPLPRYTWGGADGREFLRRFLSDIPRILKNGGRLLATASSLVGVDWVASTLESHGLCVRVLECELVKCGKMLRELLDYIRSLNHASVISLNGEPHWLLAVLEGEKRGQVL
jgi:methylase of polypeptide subunit release factors